MFSFILGVAVGALGMRYWPAIKATIDKQIK